MGYKLTDIKKLFIKSGGICAFPNCFQELIIHADKDIIAYICHNVAKSSDGPRGESSISETERNREENLLLLCPTHHTIIDKDESKYSIEFLQKIKTDHEKWIKETLSKGKLWTSDVSQFYYINIPRLSILASFYGIEINFDFLENLKSLHSLKWELNKILLYFKRLFVNLKPKSIDINEISLDKKFIGATISFNEQFRTKNVPGPDFVEKGFQLKGETEKDPHIYKQFGNYKFILHIDPMWITTTTSFVNFRPSGGKGYFAGLCIIKQIDFSKKIILATPLVIGIPKSPFDDIFKEL